MPNKIKESLFFLYKDMKLAKQCLGYKGAKCGNEECQNYVCPLNDNERENECQKKRK
ncbi:hypothetical protein MUP35_01905 [Patescibacteria group bacterium]|nr:hypothetical protein [Patescibacteria group bacterium]